MEKIEQEQSVTVQTSGTVDVEARQEQTSHHAVGEIQAAVNEKREVFVLVGLPGAGKSTAAEHITEYTERQYHEECRHFEVSDFVRALYKDSHEGDVNDNDLGAWAAEWKAEEGNDFFVREMARTIHSPLMPHVTISGVRSPAEAEAVRDVFGEDSVTVVSIWTLPDERFKRKYGPNTSWESAEFETFCERNERELHEWGAIEFFLPDGEQDYIIANNGLEAALNTDVEALVDGRIGDGFPPAWDGDYYPFPEDLDAEHIASYL